MPATEKTWRDLKTMHVVFGCTGLILLVSTIWMFAADHSRQWKRYQRKMRDIDVRLTEWRMSNERTAESRQKSDVLDRELGLAKAAAPQEALFKEFVSQLEGTDTQLIETYYQNIGSASDGDDKQAARQKLLNEMSKEIRRARFAEDNLLTERKFKAADFDERRATYDLAVRDNKLPAIRDQLQDEVDAEKQQLDELTVRYESASESRKLLQSLFEQMNSDVTALDKQIEESAAEYTRLASTLNERQASYFTSSFPFLGKRWLEAPILDAFNSPLKIDNLWTKNLEIVNGSFGTVTRYDRCTTCHQSIDRSAPGSAVIPLYESLHEAVFEITLPESAPASELDNEGKALPPTLLTVFGINLATSGLVNTDDVTINRVLPESLAATARFVSGDKESDNGLIVGDVISHVNQETVVSAQQAEQYMLDDTDWGSTVTLRVRRGLPNPYSSHPRLDLFVGSLSPHKLATFGCSICHEGQGSATDFKWVSHSPNDEEQKREWMRKYGWFNNHHWIYPMYPKRFAESSCLKCHHEVVELELTDRFPDPPAPKLMKGFHLIRQYGCFGCHEINGYNGPDTRIGPDLRLEPNFFAGAAQIKADKNFSKLGAEQQDWVKQLIVHPDRTEVRHKLLAFLKDDEFAEQPILSETSLKQIGVLSDVETPGQLRKAGPSLRHIAGKVDQAWLYDWIRDPTHFRPSTRMPRFFGHTGHLDEGEKAETEKYDPIEILGLVTFLTQRSQPQEFVSPPDGISPSSPEEQADRGKVLFEVRGCLACHQHDDFPVGKATQGPDLSNIGDKFATADAQKTQQWLYTWLRSPNLYHPRTKMPDLFLETIEHPDGTKTDPAADIAAYLLASRKGWTPKMANPTELDGQQQTNLDGLVLEHLRTKMPVAEAEEALQEGRIPDYFAANMTGAEVELFGDIDTRKKLMYVGNKTISKYGCYACHDIPGFEDAKPIGTALAEWGRKETSKLAFEHIAEYLHHGHGGRAHENSETPDDEVDEDHHADMTDANGDAHGAGGDEGQYDDFYQEKLLEHDRIGFIWQKLKEPRSYDFGKARNKGYNDRLRMPAFNFNNAEREAVVTFVIGLVSEPPAHEFVYHAGQQRSALIRGRAVLEKYNCVGCHMVEPEEWTIDFAAGEFGPQGWNPAETYPFLRPHFTSDQISASKEAHPLRGTMQARLAGMPTIDRDGLQVIYDEFGDPVEEGIEYDPTRALYSFDLWKPALIEGEPFQVGLNPIEIPAPLISRQSPAYGGDLTKWLMHRVIELERETEPQADGKQSYGWLPPPLIGQGNKVQPEWLNEFLLNPYKIRPATFMRMPKFNMSPQEATDLVNYFAVKDNAEYPYEYTPWTETRRLDEANRKYLESVSNAEGDEKPAGGTRLHDAMNIVTSNDYCVKCHLVSDFNPGGSIRAQAPDLSNVYRRLRPNYVRDWIANPIQFAPYTPMPVNIPFNEDAPNMGGVNQNLYHGTSVEQLDAVVDLLMNYPRYSSSRAKVAELVKPVTAEDAEASGTDGAE